MVGLTSLLAKEEQVDELLQRVDSPLKVANDPEADGRPYIICDHNREKDSYRSPWSNSYYPPLDDSDTNNENAVGLKPNYHLRELEILANEVFQIYQQLYYGKEDAVSSVYIWDTSSIPNAKTAKSSTVTSAQNNANPYGNAFAAIFLIRKELKTSSPDEPSEFWNSIHVVDVSPISTTLTCTYKLTTTILISMDASQNATTNISGSLTRQVEKTCAVDKEGKTHLENIGKMIEDTEHFLRCNMDSLYIQKTREVLEHLRPGNEGGFESGGVSKSSTSETGVEGRKAMHASLLNQAILARAAKNES